MPATHYLKAEPRWVSRIRGNQKHAEVRVDDRDFQTGDVIEFCLANGTLAGVSRTITHVLRAAEGLVPGYVVLSLADPRVADLAAGSAGERATGPFQPIAAGPRAESGGEAMSILNGGLPKKANESIEDFVAEFIDHITPQEWATLRAMPAFRDVLELVSIVVFIRSLPTWPLPPEHPLNPSRRYEVTA